MKRALMCFLIVSALAGMLARGVPEPCSGNGDKELQGKASSFAPRPNSKKHAYGAPVQKPILSHRAKHKPASAGTATHSERAPSR